MTDTAQKIELLERRVAVLETALNAEQRIRTAAAGVLAQLDARDVELRRIDRRLDMLAAWLDEVHDGERPTHRTQ